MIRYRPDGLSSLSVEARGSVQYWSGVVDERRNAAADAEGNHRAGTQEPRELVLEQYDSARL
jgi:hypothetical protein